MIEVWLAISYFCMNIVTSKVCTKIIRSQIFSTVDDDEEQGEKDMNTRAVTAGPAS